jgi:hypothetical protein
MKYAVAITILAAYPLFAQDAVTVPSGKRIQLAVSGVISAVSLDSHIADVSVENGNLLVKGGDPGDTMAVVMTADGSQNIALHVSLGTPAYPPGFVPHTGSDNNSGIYEIRYSSDRDQIENTLDLIRHAPGRTTTLHFVSATLPEGPQRTTFVPAVYYRITTQQSDVTLLDQNVNETPLTLQNVTIRGLHAREDGWRFHAGYTASADFADIFIPTEKEFAAGLNHITYFYDKHFSLIPGIYFLRSIDLVDGKQRSASIASLASGLNLFSSWKLTSEIAYGHSFGYAAELNHETDSTKLKARVMDRKLDFPSLRTSALPGLNADSSLTQSIGAKLLLVAGASVSDISLNRVEQDSQSAFANVNYKLSRSWSVGTGVNYGYFRNANLYTEKTLMLPEQIRFDRAFFGIGLQYQSSMESHSLSRGAGVRQTARLNWRHMQFSEYVDWQKDALSVSSLTSQVPGLQEALLHLRITSITAEELNTLLQDTAFLERLGVSSLAQVIAVPTRLQEGLSMSWVSTGLHPNQLSVTVIASHNRLITSSSDEYDMTGSFSHQLRAADQLQISWSAVKADLGGHSEISPLISASWRHSFAHSPALAVSRKNLGIGGTVFVDPSRQGTYHAGMETLPGVKVILDGQKTAITDTQGHFRFGNLDASDHRIQVEFQSSRDHYFTTAQDVALVGGSVMNFGIAFPKNDLWGYVKDDAGFGMENVKLHVTGAVQTEVVTNHSGKFILPDAQPGTYHLEVIPDTVPLGYSTENLEPIEVKMEEKTIPHATFTVPAIRILMGVVSVYDTTVGSYIPVKDAEVSLPQLGRTLKTNEEGRFTAADLPPGDLLIKMVAGTSSASSTVNFSVQPETQRRDFRISALDGKVVSTGAGGSR